jgi:hypothetical protein
MMVVGDFWEGWKYLIMIDVADIGHVTVTATVVEK